MSIQSEILTIKGNREFVTAEEVVSWARAHPDSSLHNAADFCGWDVQKSAYEHWLWAARRLIALHVTYEDGERRLVSLSLDRTRDHGGYRDMEDVLRDDSLREILLSDALRELERVQAKYERLRQLQPVWAALKRVRVKRRYGKEGQKRTA